MTVAQGEACKILLVEDDSDLSFVLALTLREAGFTVRSAMNGRQAMDQLQLTLPADVPGLILLDHMMPGMNGTEVRLAQLKDPAISSIPVVMLSGDGDVKHRAAALRVDYLLKPVDLDELLLTVARHCRPPAA